MAIAKYSRRAINDLKNIWHFIAEKSGNEAIADQFVQTVRDTALRYADQPLIGIPREDLKPGLRLFIVGSYLGFYRPKSWGIDVFRVIHGSRNLPRQLKS